MQNGGQNDGEKCSVNWASTRCTDASLDIDQQNGGQFGSETITVSQPQATVYTVHVVNYNSVDATETAGISLQVMNAQGTILTAHAPSPREADKYEEAPSSAFDGTYRAESKYLRVFCVDNRDPTSPTVLPALMYSREPPRLLESCAGI